MDIRLDVEFFQHPKTIKLERTLGLKGIKALIQLWMWTAKNRPDGQFFNMDADDIAIAAQWDGPAEDFVSELLNLRWLDKDDKIYRLHHWLERNEWAAKAPQRADKARFSRLASVAPAEHKRLLGQGIQSISREDYLLIVTKAQPTVDGSLTTRQRDVKAASTPSPSPSPFPSPSKKIEETQEITKTLRAYHAFPGYRAEVKEKELTWLQGLMGQYPDIDVLERIRQAGEWAIKKNFQGDPRQFLSQWLMKLSNSNTPTKP